jgi:hypothetical protein
MINVYSLFEQAFRDVCGTHERQTKAHFELDPKKYDDILLKKIKLQSLVSQRALYLKDVDDLYSSLSEKDSEEFDISEIDYQFHIFSRQLLLGREQIQKRLKSYSNLNSDEKNILESKFHSLTARQISGLLDSRRSFEQYIESNLWIQRGTLSINVEDIEELFPELQSRNSELYIKLRDYLALHGNLDDLPRALLWQCFRLYQSSPKELKKIAETFDLWFSLKDCIQYGILDESFLENLAIRYIWVDVWSKISDRHKKRYFNNMVHDDSLKISSNDIQNLEHLLENNADIRDILQSAFQKEMDFISEHWTDPIIWDLHPDTINKGTDQERYLWHRVWLEKMERLLIQKWISFRGIEKIQEWAVLSFLDPNDKKTVHTIRIDKEDAEIDVIENGIEYTILTASNWVWTGSSEKNKVSYSEFGSMLLHMHEARVFSASEFEETIVTDIDKSTKDANLLTLSGNEKIFDQWINVEGVITREKFLEEINTIHDPKWKEIPFETGTSFISKSWENGFEDREFSYEILSIDDSGIRVQWIDFLISYSQFLEIIQKQGFRRIGKITTDSDFVQALVWFWVDPHAKIKDGILILDEHSHGHDDHWGDHGHDSHGHHTESWPKTISYFTSKSWWHIKVFEMKDGSVAFGEWRGVMDIDKVQKANSAGKVSEKEIKKLYTKEPTMSYGMFLDYLKKNDYTASSVDLLQDPDASYHGAHFHMDETFLKRWMRNPSLADIFHGVSGVIHAAEHYFEKGSKLNGSRSALWIAKKLNLPQDIQAQLQADEIGNMKGIIEKIKDKLKWLNGPVARNKALHIAHMKWSRPEEIAAAALYMVEGYGHLYAEDIAHAEGTESFIHALIYSCWYTSPEQIHEQKVKARNKFRAELWTEKGNQITEMEMIWWFLKAMDGNADENPLAGALVKAMGGPSYWEKCIRADGLKWAVDKWKRQTADIPNAQGRMNKYLSALATHEFHTAAWMMYNIPAKDVSPEMQWAPILWALCGMTQYAGTKLVQDHLWPFVSSQGHSFHAYSFLRNKPLNDLYKDVFLSAMEWIADPSDIKSIRTSIQAVQLDGHRDPDDKDLSKKQLKHFQNINNIWRKYSNKWLHARLQGHDTWMIDQIHTHHNTKVSEYFEYIWSHTHPMMSDINPPNSDCWWAQQRWYTQSMILKKTPDNLVSLAWQLNKISTAWSNNFALHEIKFSQFWDPILGSFENLRASELPDDLKRKQYFQFRNDVIEHFRRLLYSYARWDMDMALRSIRGQPYSKDLLRMGITLEEIFTQEYSIHDWIAESDYQYWLQGWRILSTTQETQQVQKQTSDLLEKMKDNNSWASSKLKNMFGKNRSPSRNEEIAEV